MNCSIDTLACCIAVKMSKIQFCAVTSVIVSDVLSEKGKSQEKVENPVKLNSI